MDGKARRAPPPLQLVTGDRYNLTLGVAAAFCLAAAKDQPNLPPFARWSLNAYTNWNLAFIALRVVANQQQWDPFLLTNSVGIVLGFRTAFCQGLDENMRKKIRGLGLPLPRWLFVCLDHLCHTVPPIVLLAALLRRKQRVPRINTIYTLILSTWFAFRQNAMLDASDLYVPHPWKRAWAGIGAGVLATPPFVDACIDRSPRRIAFYAALLLAPWLSARLDPNLRLKYNFECRLSEAQVCCTPPLMPCVTLDARALTPTASRHRSRLLRTVVRRPRTRRSASAPYTEAATAAAAAIRRLAARRQSAHRSRGRPRRRRCCTALLARGRNDSCSARVCKGPCKACAIGV